MLIRQTTDIDSLRRFWDKRPLLYIYELGDLAPAWSRWCSFWGGFEDGRLVVAALQYNKFDTPVLLLLAPGINDTLCQFAAELAPHLPDRLYVHIHPDLVDSLPGFLPGDATPALKMGLADRTALPPAPACETLTSEHGPEVRALLDAAYPGHYFDEATLATGVYRGIREGGELVAVGGVHVNAPEEGVAALGNIGVRTDRRGHGLGRAVTLAVCHALPSEVRCIGLNVYAHNEAAIRIYQRLGFVKVADYLETTLARVPAAAQTP
ncbi:MAG: GNAT family N-acetyltransferase [Candidatus Cloacimonetes bacterium]|nr:GNAT family N-acetyltransferase [Candidatus Cloacimonadota bacterium]